MRSFALAAAAGIVILCTGCASVTQGTTHSLRIDTQAGSGDLLEGADCTLSNDHGTTIAKSGTSTQVRRSSKDLEIVCTAPGQADAKARLVSRANAGLAGNIIVGGAIGAVIDHNTGAAYTYPTWVRMVFGQFAVFDRREEREGTAMTGPGATLVQDAGAGKSVSPVAIATPSAPRVATPVQPDAPLAQGHTFDYRVTDRATGREQTIVLRAERVDGTEVSFNQGARVESAGGQLVRLNAALVGELDQVTPPGGWMAGGRMPAGSWQMKHRSIVPSSTMSYDLDARVEGEQAMRIAGHELRTLRIDLRGWAENRAGLVPVRARYEGTAWLSPDLGRVVRYEARSRTSSNAGGAFFEINEVAELVRIGRD